jgi:hypothetical protein
MYVLIFYKNGGGYVSWFVLALSNKSKTCVLETIILGKVKGKGGIYILIFK